MSDANTQQPTREDDELLRLWQHDPSAQADAERAARAMMARVWRFDQQILWRTSVSTRSGSC